jgi:hypothetical protein
VAERTNPADAADAYPETDGLTDAPPNTDGDAGVFDAQTDAWKCVQFDVDGGKYIFVPVECPDDDYYITINGDGPPQTLRSNYWGDGYYPSYA